MMKNQKTLSSFQNKLSNSQTIELTIENQNMIKGGVNILGNDSSNQEEGVIDLVMDSTNTYFDLGTLDLL